MTVQQQVRLRYRSEGHLRFDFPAVLAETAVGNRLAARLRATDGVYRVDWYGRQRKLSIRFVESICDYSFIVRHIHRLLSELCREPANSSGVAEGQSGGLKPIARSQWNDWVAEKKQAAGETVTALRLIMRAAWSAASASFRHRPRWITDFMNDVLMLYLIKVHWHAITQLWLPNPWRYRYEWAATFYVIFLQVQSRLPQRT